MFFIEIRLPEEDREEANAQLGLCEGSFGFCSYKQGRLSQKGSAGPFLPARENVANDPDTVQPIQQCCKLGNVGRLFPFSADFTGVCLSSWK